MGKNNFYSSKTPSYSPYASSSTTEPDMRKEFINTLEGFYPEISKGQIGLLRRMNRNNNDQLIACSCVDLVTKEPDKDRFCTICYGEGFLWHEEPILIYRVLLNSGEINATLNKAGGIGPAGEYRTPGLINAPLVVFYIRYDTDITIKDKIVRLVLDTEGDPVIPRKRQGIYRVNNAWDYRADNGKLEYWKVFTHFEDVKYLNAPKYEEI